MARPFARKAPRDDIDESDLEVGGEAHAAAGRTAVAVALERAVEHRGPRAADRLCRGVLPGDEPARPARLEAEGSNTPTSKSVVVRLQAPGGGKAGVTRPAKADVEHGHKRVTDPIQQS